MGNEDHVTHSHGSEGRRRMLVDRYHESRRRQRAAEDVHDGFESSKQKGNADHFRQLLFEEYGVNVDG